MWVWEKAIVYSSWLIELLWKLVDGKKNYYLLEGRKFCSNLLYKLFPPMPCPSLKFLFFAKESLTRCRNFDGVTKTTRKGCIGWHGRICMFQKTKGVWALEIYTFNLALLAKQAWRLLDNPNYLCAIMLRAKYFLEGDLMNASLKKDSSFTWQIITAGVNSLRNGYVWRVGNGENIDI